MTGVFREILGKLYAERGRWVNQAELYDASDSAKRVTSKGVAAGMLVRKGLIEVRLIGRDEYELRITDKGIREWQAMSN